ncbi:hypothetical protein [Lysobacter auxotrophicus]|uniref:DUF5625 domain-containing protein n=1 Tax=Lysobacter auxotrophicus TaxID=2992573 RepID=A0ABM8DDI1_9GAMM|nr:hypothetical protein [Lysobacter auxotrophicus]BDU16660.1 hypothetical protein LA521A_18610 [Lysobacter auxotrophicus]
MHLIASLTPAKHAIRGVLSAGALLLGGMTACSSGDHTLFRAPLGNRPVVRGSFEVREHAFYSVAIEAVLAKANPATKQRAFAFLRYHESPGHASVSLRRVEGDSPGEWIRLTAVNSRPSSWNSATITTELERIDLDRGRYELEVSVSGKTYVDESFTSYLIVERAYVGK